MPKLRGKFHIVWLFLLLFLFSSFGLFAQNADEERLIDMIGTGIISGSNSAKARQEAISSGLIAAVHLLLSETISREMIISNFQILNDAVYSNILQFIKDYKVLTESVNGGTYRVMVQATVLNSRIASKLSTLGIMSGKASYPSILFLIAEKKIKDKRYQYWWGDDASGKGNTEESMSEMMTQKGFKVTDHPSSMSRNYGSYDLSDKNAVQLGKQFGADVVVFGRCTAGVLPNSMKGAVNSFTARIEVKAIATESGELIAESSKTSIASNMDEDLGSTESLRKAGLLGAEDISFKIIEAWQKESNLNEMIEVKVDGTGGNIAHFVKLRSGIAEMSGVNSLQLKEMMPNTATLLVDYQGSARAFADAMILKKFQGFAIDISDVAEGKISVRIVIKK